MLTLPKYRPLGAPPVGVKRNLWRTQQGLVSRMNFPIDGLVFYAPLWHPELSGSPFLSKDLNAHVCTVTGATWGLQGRTFSTPGDVISVPDADSLDIIGDLTLEAWFKLNSVVGAHFFINKWETNLSDKAYMLYLVGANPHLVLRNAANDSEVDLAAATTLLINTWYHLVGVHSGTAMYLFINGAQDVNTESIGTGRASTNLLQLGNYISGNPLNGVEGEARIYNRALSLAEIQHNYLVTKRRYA